MNDRESLAEAAKRKAREGSFATEARRVPATNGADTQEEVEDCGAYGYLRGVRERAVHLEFRRKTGTWPAPGYSWLLKPIFDPNGAITLVYASGDRVVIRGRNLRPIFERILKHQALWIAEQGQEWRSQGTEGLSVVYVIDYHDADEETVAHGQ